MASTVRKAPSAKTLRQLYLLSGNLCANPKCDTVLVNANGTMVADVCHIKAESPGGPRFDKTLTEEQRRSADNLVLFCSTCHTLVDREATKYTVQVLTKWKKDREARFAAVGDSLRQRYLQAIADEAELTDLSIPRSLRSYIKFLKKNKYTHNVSLRTIKDLTAYIDQLRHLSLPDRDLMRAIIEKALSLGARRERWGGVSVHPNDLKTILIENRRLSDYRIRKLGNTLDRNQLGGIEVDDREPQLNISAPDDDLQWSDLKKFLEGRNRSLRDVICDLKFSLLD